MLIAIMVILIISCKNPTNPVSDGGLQIDASDPLDVLRALPSELNRPDSMIARYASPISRAATVPTADSEVFHPDAEICPPLAKVKIDTASLAVSIVQILKKMSDNPFNATIVVDSKDAVSLGKLTMEAEIMKPLNADPSNLEIDYHGIQIDTIAASDSPSGVRPNGVSGFAYYLPFTFQHESGPYELYNYFEFFFEDTENMVLTAVTYVYVPDEPKKYCKYHTTIMTIDEGDQIIERYENTATQGIFDDDDYTYEYLSYNMQSDTTQAYIISRGSYEGIFAVTADQYGGMAISTTPFEGKIYGKREAFAEDFNIMARFSDSDIGTNLPSDFSTALDSTYCEYSYRYLEDIGADSSALLSTANIISDDGTPGTVAQVYAFDMSSPTDGVVDDSSDPFLLGVTNSNIINYVTEKVDSYYLDIYDTLEANLDPTDTQAAPGWIRMDTANLGVDNDSALAAVFDAIQAL